MHDRDIEYCWITDALSTHMERDPDHATRELRILSMPIRDLSHGLFSGHNRTSEDNPD
jgi:hypothetical protein